MAVALPPGPHCCWTACSVQVTFLLLLLGVFFFVSCIVFCFFFCRTCYRMCCPRCMFCQHDLLLLAAVWVCMNDNKQCQNCLLHVVINLGMCSGTHHSLHKAMSLCTVHYTMHLARAHGPPGAECPQYTILHLHKLHEIIGCTQLPATGH